MGKKKVKPNGFSVFMHEIIDRERRSGRKHPKEDWAKIAKPHYDKLTAEQKERYKQKAKNMPSRVVYQAPKYTSQGISLEEIEREQRELEQKKRYMERKISTEVENAFLDNEIKTKEFVFIMANYFYKTMVGLYSPAEVAVAKFTFESGIVKRYQTFVNPGTVALGYAYEAKERSEKIHRLPPPDLSNALGETNYEKVYKGILDVLGVEYGERFDMTDSRRPSVYIRKQDIEMMESILDQLSDKQWKNTFDLFELELLFNELKNKVEPAMLMGPIGGSQRIRITVTNAFIEQDRYDALPNISCDHHEKEDATRYCALSCVQRWFYLFADHVCERIGVQLIAGTHLPANARLEPVEPFDNPFENTKKSFGDDDHSTFVSSSYTGYSKFKDTGDSSSDEY